MTEACKERSDESKRHGYQHSRIPLASDDSDQHLAAHGLPIRRSIGNENDLEGDAIFAFEKCQDAVDSYRPSFWFGQCAHNTALLYQ